VELDPIIPDTVLTASIPTPRPIPLFTASPNDDPVCCCWGVETGTEVVFGTGFEGDRRREVLLGISII